jgi:hypothetical protein
LRLEQKKKRRERAKKFVSAAVFVVTARDERSRKSESERRGGWEDAWLKNSFILVFNETLIIIK